MADKTPALAYLPEVNEEAARLNREHEEALTRLSTALDQRKNRFFDPRYLAAAQAFLTPTKTGSFFEALGTAAGAVGQAQEGLMKEEQDIAKLGVDVASQRIALQRQRELDRMYEQERPEAVLQAVEAQNQMALCRVTILSCSAFLLAKALQRQRLSTPSI